MSSGHQRITWRRNIAENFNRLSRVHERYRQTTDGRTTDGRTTTYSEHEHEFMFAKNCLWEFHLMYNFGTVVHKDELIRF